jgi:hypothetical protein
MSEWYKVRDGVYICANSDLINFDDKTQSRGSWLLFFRDVICAVGYFSWMCSGLFFIVLILLLFSDVMCVLYTSNVEEVLCILYSYISYMHVSVTQIHFVTRPHILILYSYVQVNPWGVVLRTVQQQVSSRLFSSLSSLSRNTSTPSKAALFDVEKKSEIY